MVDGDVLQGNSQAVGADLGEDGLMSLAHGGDAQVDGHLGPRRRLRAILSRVLLHPPLTREWALERPSRVGDGDSGAFAGIAGSGALDEARGTDAVVLAVNFSCPTLRSAAIHSRSRPAPASAVPGNFRCRR